MPAAWQWTRRPSLPTGAERIAKLQAAIAALAAKKGVAPEAIALAWLLRHPAGIVPILGTIRPERIRTACQALTVNLSREEWNVLFKLGRGRSLP